MSLALVAMGLALVVVGVPAPAYAAPAVSLSKSTDAEVLVGGQMQVTLRVTNPGTENEYNLSFRDPLPDGVTYVPGSTTPASAGDPTITTDASGAQTLVWPDVADVRPGATVTLTFRVAVDPDVYPVGSTVDNTAEVFANTDPTVVPEVDATTETDYTESATSNTSATTVTAVEVEKTSSNTPEGELLRGVHDHRSTYTLTVTNNNSQTFDDPVLVDYLPAGLEYLACGNVDNSAGPEYPGAGSLAQSAVAGCVAPTRVDTVNSPAGLSGVFTVVTWNLADLAPGATRTITYAAGIPQFANTTSFPGGKPGPVTRRQAANLDNNTGASTRETTTEQQLTNHATVEGTYPGDVADGTSDDITASTDHTVSAEDVAMQKSVTPSQFSAGDIATYTLTIRASEYDNASGISVTDVLPAGLCPLSPSQNYSADTAAECAPLAGTAPTGASYDTVTDTAGGTTTITFSDVTLAHNGVTTITYQARMRSTYPGGSPTNAGDVFTNHADLTATTRPRPGVQPEGGAETVEDSSEATLDSARPTLTKAIQPNATPMTCATSAAAYQTDPDPADVTFHEGDRVCFLITAQFPGSIQTKNVTIAEVLPDGMTYEAGSAQPTAASTATAAIQPDTGRGPSWQVGTVAGGDRYVGRGQVFQWRLSAIVTTAPPVDGAPRTVTNRAKLGAENTDGAVGSIRDALDFRVAAPPPATIAKSADGLTDGATVQSGQLITYHVAVGNGGTAAQSTDLPIVGPDVWDVLPAGITCAAITAISNGGACTDPGAAGQPTFAGNDTRSAIRWNLPDSVTIAPAGTLDLSYQMRVPTNASVGITYTNTASVASYATTTNTGGTAQHHPADNVDTTTPAAQVDAPRATDDFTVRTQVLRVTKSNVTAIGEDGNTRTPGDLTDTEDAVIGEGVTYTITGTVPAHSSVYNGVLSDTLPTGITFLSATTSAVPPGGSFDAATGTLTFPAQYDNNDDSDDVFTVTVQARVSTDASNVHGTTRTNTARFVSTPGASGTPAGPQATSAVRVAEPSPTLAKVDDDDNGVVVGDQPITYTITAGNAAGRPPLHDPYLVDCVPDGLVVDDPGTATQGTGNGSNGCANGETRLFWDAADLGGTILGGATVEVSYVAHVDPASAVSLGTYTNRATLVGTDLADGSPTTNPLEREYTASATDTVQVAPAQVEKTVDEPTATIGERRAYTVTLTVPENVNFYDAMIADLLPADLDESTVRLDGAPTCAPAAYCSGFAPVRLANAPGPDGGTYIGYGFGDIGSAPVERTVVFQYDAVVIDAGGPVAGDSIVNGVRAQWDTTTNGTNPTSAGADLESKSNTASATVTVLEPDLDIAKSVSNPTPAAADVFTYTVEVSNATGSTVSAAFDATVVDTIPNGVVVDTGSITGGGTFAPDGTPGNGGGTITWRIPGPVAPGDTVTFTYDASLSSPPPTGPATNTADITRYFSLDDDVPANAGDRQYDGPSATATVTPAVPHVTVTKDVLNGDLAYIGESKAWQVTVESDGQVPARNVDVTDVLPPSWTYDAGSAQVDGDPVEPTTSTSGNVQTLRWNDVVATLAVGDSVTIVFTATPGEGVVDDPGVGHSIAQTNTASVRAEDAAGSTGPAGQPYNSGPDTAVAHIDAADVTVAKTHTGDVVAGEEITWQVHVENDGPDTAVGAFRVVDTYPVRVVSVEAEGSGWSCTTGVVRVVCTRSNAADTLAAGAAFPDITVTGRVPSSTPAGTQLVNRVTVSDRTYDPDLDNNSDDDTATVTAEADLAIVKTLTTDLVAGENATYELDVVNNGPSVHRGLITVTDTLPLGTTFVSQTSTGWTFSQSGRTLTWTRSDPAAVGSTSQITVTVKVDPGRTGPVTNTAEIDGTLPDPVPSNNEDDATDTPGQSADLLLEKRHLGGNFVAGSTGTYEFSVLNAGPSVARPVVRITDTLPADLTYVSSTSVRGSWTCSAAGQALTCNLAGSLGVGEVVTVQVTVAIDPDYAGDPIHNTAHAESPTPDPNPANNDDDDDSDVDSVSDLAITKTHTGTAVAGDDFTFQVQVTNNGPSTTSGPVTIGDVLPRGMTYVSAAGTGWSCSVSPTLPRVGACQHAGALAPGATTSVLDLTVHLAPDAGPTTMVNRVVVDGPPDGSDSDLSNNTDSDAVDVVDDVEISVDKTVTGPDPVVAGDTTSFAITATNDGPSTADDVRVEDALPAGMSIVSISGDGWDCRTTPEPICTLDELAPGTTSTPITVVARVASDVATGTVLTDVATVSTSTDGDTPAGNTDDASVVVRRDADLALVKTHPGGRLVVPGTTTRFTIDVTNNGPSDARAPLTVVDDLPPGMTYVSSDGGWDCSAASAGDHQRVTCTLDEDLVAGLAAPTLGLTVLVDDDLPLGTATNVATVSSPTPDSNPDNDSDDAQVRVVPAADLSIVKTHEGEAKVGEALTFELAVHNQGPSVANDVVVTDTLPTGLEYVAATGTGWTCGEASGTITCTLAGSLAVDADAPPISVTVDVLPSAYPEVVNTAHVDGAAPDIHPRDNTDDDVVEVPPLVNEQLRKRHVGTMAVGARGHYVIAVRNAGPTPDPGPVRVVDHLPVGLEYVAASGRGWTCDAVRRLVTCVRDDLGIRTAPLIQVTVDVLPSAYPSVTNVAVVTTPSEETTLADNSDDDVVDVVPLVHLEVDKSVVDATADRVRWDITVTNDGPNATVGAVVVTDDLPDGLDYVDAHGSGWACSSVADDVTCTHDGSLAVGASSTIHLTTSVAADAPDEITNVAVVGGGGDRDRHADDATTDIPTVPGLGPDNGGDVPGSGALPDTGGPSVLVPLLGLVLVTLGGGLVLVSRRRGAAR